MIWWRIDNILTDKEKKEYYKKDLGEKQLFNREWKEELIHCIRNEDILIDYDVTPDPRRIIRLPRTVHGKTLRLCKIITKEELEYSDSQVIGYNQNDPIG